MQITFDPTERGEQKLECPKGKTLTWDNFDEKETGRLIRELKKLNLGSSDELRVIVGPGSFASIRQAAVVGNAVGFLTGVKLSARQVGEEKWQRVDQLAPYYATPPAITQSKKC